MKPRRILIFSLSYFPRYVGGAEVAVKEITDRIAPSELIFDMITLGDGTSPREERIGNIQVYRVLSSNGTMSKALYPFAAYFRAKRLALDAQYGCIWAIMAGHAGFAAHLFKKRFPGVPMLLTVQEGDRFKLREGLFRPLGAKVFKSADRIQSISRYLADWSRSMGAVCRTDVVPNAVDYDLFARDVSDDEKRRTADKLAKKEGDSFVISTSRLVMKNGYADLISSLQFLPKTVKLIVLGAGPLEGDLKRLALKLGLNYTDEPPVNPGNRVHFLGYIPHKDMPPYLAISEVFARPALTEGLGNSFLEAMAAGIPVIGTPVGGIPDFLTDGETGLVCEPGNPRSVAQKVEKALKDAESRAYIVKKARALVKERYRWERIAADMKRIFDETAHV